MSIPPVDVDGYVTVGLPLQRDLEMRAAGNLDFCRLLLIFQDLERSR
jgi:hypothetical protein